MIVGYNLDTRSKKVVRKSIDGEKLKNIDAGDDLQRVLAEIETGDGKVDAIIIGTAVKDPISVAQRIHFIDKDISLIILCSAVDFHRMLDGLQFAPFLGEEVSCQSVEQVEELGKKVKEAVRNTKKRRLYSNTVSAMNLQIPGQTSLQLQSVRYVDSLLDFAPIGVVLVDQSYKVLAWNKKADELFGQHERDVIGSSFLRFFTKNQQDRLKDIITAINAQNMIRKGIFQRNNGRNGHTFLEVTASHLYSSPTNIILIIEDITERKKYEDEIKESEQRFRSLADSAPMYIAMADEAGNAVYFNKPWLEYTGKSLEEMTGMGWLRTLHPEDAPKFEKAFKHAFKKQIPINGQYRFQNRKGEYRWMLAVGAPRLTQDGRCIGYVGTYTDIDDLKEAQLVVQQSQERFRVVTDNATTGLFIMDDKQYCTFMNPAAEQITGFTFATIQKAKKPLHDIIHNKRPDGSYYPMSECPIDRALPQKNQTQGEDIFVRRDGTFYPVAFTASPIISNGKPVGTVIEVRDTTEEKKLEERRSQLERQKDEFIGIASHELKTPVTSIKAYGQVLQTMFERKGDRQAAEQLRKMDAQINKLTSLIGDLLDVTKIQSGRLLIKEDYFDFNELIAEIVEEMQRTTDKHTLIMDLATSKEVFGDRERIGQVLINLLSNAIKYSPYSDKIAIRSESNKKTVTVCVQDYGVGIPEDKLDKVFEQFYRVSGDKQHTFPGLGLGLYISSEIIKRQGGRIWVTSAIGKGSTFCFSLPIQKRKMKQEKNKLADEEVQHE